MTLIRSIDDIFNCADNIRLHRREMPPWKVFILPPGGIGTGSITILHEPGSHGYIRTDLVLNKAFSYYHCIGEQFLEFSLLPVSATESPPSPPLIPRHSGRGRHSFFTINKCSLTKSWLYLPAGTIFSGESIIIREQMWRMRLGTQIRKRFGHEVDLPTVLEHAAAQATPELMQILAGFDGKGDPRPALQSKKNELLSFFRNQIQLMEKKPAFLQGTYERNVVKSTMLYIQENVACTPCVEDLARRAGLNIHKLEAAFREVTGLSVGEYTRAYRMALALDMLEEGMNIRDVSVAIGYKSAHRFCEAFEQMFGAHPSLYKAEVQRERAYSVVR